MCGIAGFFPLSGENTSNRDKDYSDINAMLEAIVHRGPDSEGIWSDPEASGVTLGHRRLAIIDLTEAGHQPMISHSRRYVMVYNGEIYNSSYIIGLLRQNGYTDPFNGTSDTEILLEAIEKLGIEQTLSACKGMFAIALYDRMTQTISLARDRIGEKPLYYGQVDGKFVFASELGAVSRLSATKLEINHQILASFLKYGYIPCPYTIYKNVNKLEPGTILTTKIKSGFNNIHQTKYWSIDKCAENGQRNLFTGTRMEATEQLEKLLLDAIKEQMISDVPLGAFLSAGIDSATVVSLMTQASSNIVKTFTIGFEEADYDEAEPAADIARHLGTEHTQLYVTKQDALEVIPHIASMFGEPFADSSQIPTYLVSSMTRKHVTVALSGDGGDELFAGYRDYFGVSSIYNRIKKIPCPMRKLAGHMMEAMYPLGDRGRIISAHGRLLGADGTMDLYRRTYETDKLVNKLIRSASDIAAPSIYDEMCSDSRKSDSQYAYLTSDPVHSAMLMNMKMYHPDDILCKVDRTAMAVSLETRVPMLDRDVVEFAWSLPLEYLKDEKTGKLVLRDVLYRHVPRELMDRPKKGFGVPVSKWLKEEPLYSWANQKLNQESINRHGLINADYVNSIWNDYINKDIWRPVIWYILILQNWLDDVYCV